MPRRNFDILRFNIRHSAVGFARSLHPRKLKHPLVLLLIVSLLLRLGVWFWVVQHVVPPTFDETYYAARTAAFAEILAGLVKGVRPDAVLRDAVYCHGVWPPLHPLLMSFGWVWGGLAGARLIVVLASWLTTLLLVRLARASGFPERVALGAGWIHAVLPETIAYSHFLWSETLFTGFVVAGLLACLRGWRQAHSTLGERAPPLVDAAVKTPEFAGLATSLKNRRFTNHEVRMSKAGIRNGSYSFEILRLGILRFCGFVGRARSKWPFSNRRKKIPFKPALTPPVSRGSVWPLLAGLLLGCAGLCRASILPLVLLLGAGWCVVPVPDGAAGRGWRRWTVAWRGLLRAMLFLGMFALILSPWMWTLRQREGRWVPLATSGDYNFYIGNNPLVQRELGSAWGTTATTAYQHLVRAIIERHYGGDEAAYRADPRGHDLARGFSFREPARELALEHIRRDLPGALRRGALRLWLLPGPDMFMVRHLLNLAYPPLPDWLVALLWAGSWCAHLALLCGLAAGVWSRGIWPRACGLILAALTLMIPVALTISVSRLRFTATVLLLPVVAAGGLGLVRGLHRRCGGVSWWRRVGVAVTALVLLAAAVHSARASMRYHFTPSTYYAKLLSGIMPRAGAALRCTDGITLLCRRGGPDFVSVELLPAGEVVLDPSPWQTMGRFDLRSGAAQFRVNSRSGGPVALRVTDPVGGRTVEIVLKNRRAWRNPTPTGIPGLSYLVDGANGL